MAGNFPTNSELAEAVRQYSKALIILSYLQGEHDSTPVLGPDADSPQFGDNPKQVAKIYKASKKKRKGRSFTLVDAGLRASWAGVPAPSESELAELAEQARRALERAEKLAGEPVAYVAGTIIPDRLVDEDAPARSIERYKIINGW